VALLENSLVQELRLTYCEFAMGSFPSLDIAQRQVAQSFGANSTVTTLWLDHSVENEVYFCAILNALQSNATVQRLTLRRTSPLFGTMPALAINAIGSLLQSSTCAVTNICLDRFNWIDNLFDPIAIGIRNSLKIESLEFSDCHFPLSASHQLHSIFSQDSTASRLTLSGNVAFPFPDGNRTLTDIIQASPALRELSLVRFDGYSDEIKLFQAICDGLASESCSVQRLLLDSLQYAFCPVFCQAFTCFHKVRYVAFDVPTPNAIAISKL
jgi:hypothetical protein